MLKRLKIFVKDEDGAVTVDWVVLTAALAAGAVLITTTMGTSVLALTANITSFLGGWGPS